MNKNQIQDLVNQGNLKTAYQAVVQWTTTEPENKDAHVLRKQIEELIRNQNNSYLKSELSEAKSLTENQNYQVAINKLLNLQKQFPEEAEVQKLLARAYEANKNSQQVAELSSNTSLKLKLQTFIDAHKYEQALDFLRVQYEQKPSGQLQQLIEATKKQFVSYKLAKNKNQLNQISTSKALNFLKSLQSIYSDHKELNQLIQKFSQQQKRQEHHNQANYFKEQNRQIKVLYFQHEYKKCIQLANQVLKAQQHNSIAKKFLKKAKKSLEILSHKQAFKELNNYNQTLKKLSPEQKQAQYI